MPKLEVDIATVQQQIALYPGVLRRISLDAGHVNVSAYPPGSQRNEDALEFEIVFVCPSDYPASAAWLVSDNEGMSDMLSAIAPEFQSGATVELVVTRVLTLIGHEYDGLHHLFVSDGNGGANTYEDMEFEDLVTDDDYEMDGDDFECESYGEFEQDRDLMVSVGHFQGLWDKKETEFEQKTNGQQDKNHLSFKEKVAEGRQIFDTKAAYKLLCKELIDIMKEESCDVVVETIDNDVYHWAVELAGFETSSALFDDLMKLRELYGYSTVQLRITFKRGLHPFYPPHVEVVRPRFRGPVAWAVSSHPVLRLANWDPWRSQKVLLLEIKDFLQKHARVELDSIFNSLQEFPLAAYSAAEIQLARLEGLLEVRPRCAALPENKELYDSRDVHVDEARLAALTAQSKQKASTDNAGAAKNPGKGNYWAAGTGYGHGYRRGKVEVWDAKKAAAAQDAHDIETRRLLSELSQSLTTELEVKSGESSACGSAALMTYALIPTLNDSCLIPFLLKELGNISFTNMCERAEYYMSILTLIRGIAHPLLARMLFTPLSDGKSVFDCLTALEVQAQCYARILTRPDEAPNNARDTGSSSRRQTPAPKGINPEVEERFGIQLADSIIAAVMTLREQRYEDPPGAEETMEVDDKTEEDAKAPDPYTEVMKSHQLDFLSGIESLHTFGKESSGEQSCPRGRIVRLSREIAGLGSLLPLNPCSSVFVRIDDEKQTLWTAMIIGPEDTPYSGGCFLFDIYFPPNYPNSPPKVILTTTGGGKVRFNPNLYKNGKVCLSLLGTWSGAAGEVWDSSASSICQVLVSIQSLILVNEPYFNEPGYEETMHTVQGRNKSRQYNQEIREQTIHRAMIDYLRKPPPAFEKTIQAHFKLRRDHVTATCDKWIEEAKANNSTQHATRLATLVQELNTLLASL